MALVPFLSGCATVVASAGSGLAGNLTTAMMNQDDPAIVRDGAPAYLLMLDSFVEGAPDSSPVLAAAAELYSAYGVVFVDEPLRAQRLTARAQSYGQRAICAETDEMCGSWELPYDEFVEKLEFVKPKQASVLFTFGLSWIAYIQAHGDDFIALAQLPQAEAILDRVQELDPVYRAATVEHYLGILNTIRPPALGGNFEAGLAHFERALELSSGHDLGIKVDFANYYARTLYERELHDRLLLEVLSANPTQRGYTLFNTLAQENAQELLDSADSYF
jgi:tetratricopeptide (TPR) repeat protein